MILKIKDLCEKEDAGFFLVNLANGPLVRGETGEYFDAYPAMHRRQWDFLKPYRIIDNFCRKENISYLDLLYPFEERYRETKRPLHFRHDGHLNVDGMELAAELTAKELLDRDIMK